MGYRQVVAVQPQRDCRTTAVTNFIFGLVSSVTSMMMLHSHVLGSNRLLVPVTGNIRLMVIATSCGSHEQLCSYHTFHTDMTAGQGSVSIGVGLLTI